MFFIIEDVTETASARRKNPTRANSSIWLAIQVIEHHASGIEGRGLLASDNEPLNACYPFGYYGQLRPQTVQPRRPGRPRRRHGKLVGELIKLRSRDAYPAAGQPRMAG